MRTFLIALVAALLGATAAGFVQQMRLDDALEREDFADAQLEDVRAALERSHEDVHDLEQELGRLRSKGGTTHSTAIEDGRHPVLLEEVGADGMVVDVIQWLTGEAANKAAVEDGVIEEGDSVPNDYYIVNDNPMLREIPVAADVQVTLSTWDCQNVPTEKSVVFDRFVELFDGDGECVDSLAVNPYWLTVEDGVIVAIEEQYRP